MAGTKVSDLFIGSLVICFTLLPLVAAAGTPAKKVDTEEEDSKVLSSEDFFTNKVELEAPEMHQDAKINRITVKVDVYSDVVHNDDSGSKASGLSEMSDHEAFKQAMSAYFGQVMERDTELREALNSAWEQLFNQTSNGGVQHFNTSNGWGQLFNQTSNGWGQLFNTSNGWGQLFNKTSNGWGQLYNASNAWGQLFNQTSNGWGQLFNQTSNGWGQLFNQTSNGWGQLFNTSNGWGQLFNQTSNGWGQLYNASNAWGQLFNQTSNGWNQTLNHTSNGVSDEDAVKKIECLLRAIIKKKQDENAEAFFKGLMKHKSNGHYDKDFCKGWGELLKEVSKKGSQHRVSSTVGDSNCYAFCINEMTTPKSEARLPAPATV